MRAMLLWNSCIRLRTDTSLADTDKAQFALAAWTEIDAIEEALERHTCGIERSFLFQGRELLFKCVSTSVLFDVVSGVELTNCLLCLASFRVTSGSVPRRFD